MSNAGGYYPRWTNEDDELLKSSYQLTKKELLNLFPTRNYNAIKQRAYKFGLVKEHNEYCESNVKKLLQDIPESYYWLGFILADGHISNSFRLRITLAIKDKKHLKRAASFLEINKMLTINRKSPAVTIAAQDRKHLKEFIQKFDIKERKTYNPPKVGILDKMSDELFLSMFIGYIDGDGSIRNQHKRKDCFLQIHIHKAWKKFLTAISNKIEKITGIKNKKPYIGNDGYLLFTISNSEVLKFLKRKALELKLPVLSRKWDKIDLNYTSKYIKAKATKEKIIDLYNKGLKNKEICEATNMSSAYISKLIKRYNNNDLPNKNYTTLKEGIS